MFYKNHINKFGGKKVVLTKKIQEYSGNMSSANELLRMELCKLDLTTFSIKNKKATNNAFGGVHLRFVGGDEKVGKDTLFRILPDEDAPLPPSPELIEEQPCEHISKKRKLEEPIETDVETTAPAPKHNGYGKWECTRCRRENNNWSTRCTHCQCSQPTCRDNQAADVQSTQYTYNHRDLYYQPANNSTNQPQVPYHAQHWFNTTGQFGYATNHNSAYQPQFPQHYPHASQYSTSVVANTAQQFRDVSDRSSERTKEENQHPFHSNGASEPHNSSGKVADSKDEEHYRTLCTRLTQKLEKVVSGQEIVCYSPLD